MADGINAATKYIVTHRPETLQWGPVEDLGPDIVAGVRRIKFKDGLGPCYSLGQLHADIDATRTWACG